MQQKTCLYRQIIWEPDFNRVFISSGFNCNSVCLYCYIFDEGYSSDVPAPGKLSGEAIRNILHEDNHFQIGKYGTTIAFGCVSDPFHPSLEAKTLEYIQSFSDLGNPIQFATKFPLSDKAIKVISDVSNPIYPMITITTLKYCKRLEPNAPKPILRLALMKQLSEIGLRTTLLYKPVIPGINDKEHESIIQAAVLKGASYLVAGIAYMNEKIVHKLKQEGFDTSETSCAWCRQPATRLGKKQDFASTQS